MKKKKKRPFRWTTRALTDARVCRARFLRKYFLMDKPDVVTVEEQARLNLIKYLKTGNEDLISNFLMPIQEAIKEIYSWRKTGSLVVRKKIYNHWITCIPDVVYKDKSKYIVIIIRDRKGNKIKKEDLVELRISLYALQKQDYRQESYIGIFAIRNNKSPLNIKKFHYECSGTLESFTLKAIQDANNALLTGKFYNTKFCNKCEYLSSCENTGNRKTIKAF